MSCLDLSAIILTKDEEIHIRRCLDRICPIINQVFIIDCGSTDNTLTIAREYNNVIVLSHPWVNYATQFNWALDNAPIRTQWVLRLDADEYLTDELVEEMREKLPSLSNEYTGIILHLRRVFMGRTIRRGGTNNVTQMRIFRYGKARVEVRQMDEHIELLEGKPIEFNGEWADDNLNNISWWTQKHVGYAIREAVDLLDIEYDLTGTATADANVQITESAKAKRARKHSYAKKPLFWRSFAYFCYRYFFRLGFLEGKEGFMWHFFQGWWYRSLVDAKVWEIKKACGDDRSKMIEYLRDTYNIILLNTR